MSLNIIVSRLGRVKSCKKLLVLKRVGVGGVRVGGGREEEEKEGNNLNSINYYFCTRIKRRDPIKRGTVDALTTQYSISDYDLDSNLNNNINRISPSSSSSSSSSLSSSTPLPSHIPTFEELPDPPEYLIGSTVKFLQEFDPINDVPALPSSSSSSSSSSSLSSSSETDTSLDHTIIASTTRTKTTTNDEEDNNNNNNKSLEKDTITTQEDRNNNNNNNNNNALIVNTLLSTSTYDITANRSKLPSHPIRYHFTPQWQSVPAEYLPNRSTQQTLPAHITAEELSNWPTPPWKLPGFVEPSRLETVLPHTNYPELFDNSLENQKLSDQEWLMKLEKKLTMDKWDALALKNKSTTEKHMMHWHEQQQLLNAQEHALEEQKKKDLLYRLKKTPSSSSSLTTTTTGTGSNIATANNSNNIIPLQKMTVFDDPMWMTGFYVAIVIGTIFGYYIVKIKPGLPIMHTLANEENVRNNRLKDLPIAWRTDGTIINADLLSVSSSSSSSSSSIPNTNTITNVNENK